MNTTTLIIIISAAVLLLLIVAIIFIRRSNRKRFKRLQENLNKYKEENENFGSNDKVTIADDDNAVNSSIEEHIEENTDSKPKSEPIIEDYTYDEPTQPKYENKSIKITRPDRRNFYSQKKFTTDTKIDSNSANIVNDDFEEFMNEHSYTRRILDNDIMDKLKKLPPEVKAIILSNVFNKYDD